MKNGEKSFSKIFELIDLIARSSNGLSGKELSALSGIPLSTVFRMTRFLCDNNYLRSERGLYTLGAGFVLLGNAARRQNPLIKVARYYLEELSELTRETVHLAQLQEQQIIYIDKVEGKRPIRMGSMIGKTCPLHCTAVGKAVLAYLPGKRREELLNSIEYTVYTPDTITDRTELCGELELIRRQGYAVDNCEHEEWVYCLAAPILNHENESVGAISISGAAVYMLDRAKELAELVKSAAGKISGNL